MPAADAPRNANSSIPPAKQTPTPAATNTSGTVQTPQKPISRRPTSTSLTDLLQTNNKTQVTYHIEEASQETNPFTEEELIRCWNAYAATIEKKVHLKNTMINCQPVLKEDFLFEVVVHNPGQQEELLHHNASILQTLRTQLKNGKIQLTIRIDEANEKRLAYTSKEKFELLNEINPLLSKLKDEFNLMFD